MWKFQVSTIKAQSSSKDALYANERLRQGSQSLVGLPSLSRSSQQKYIPAESPKEDFLVSTGHKTWKAIEQYYLLKLPIFNSFQ